MLKKVIILLAVLAFQQLHAQRQKSATTITFDYITGLPDKNIPYDEGFTAIIPIDSMFANSDVKQVQVYRTKYDNNNNWTLRLLKTETLPVYQIPVNPKSFQAGGKGYYTLTTEIPPIPPKTPFCLIVQYKTPKDIVSSLMEVNHAIYLNNEVKAKDMFDAVQKKINTINAGYIKHVTTANVEYSYSQYSAQLTVYNYDLHYDSIKSALLYCSKEEPHFRTIIQNMTGTICNSIYQCNCTDNFAFEEHNDGIDSLLAQLCFWKKANDYAIIGLTMGIYSFFDGEKVVTAPPFEPLKLTAANFNQTIANLSRNIKALEKLRTYLLYNSYGYTIPNRELLLKHIQQLRNALNIQVEAINGEIDFFKKDLSDFRMGTGPLYGIFYTVAAENDMQDVKTAFGNHLIPDIGVLTMPAFSENKARFVVRPYWGLNISFRPINKNIRMRNLSYASPKAKGIDNTWQKFLMRTSISVGFTALPLDMELEKGEDLFKGMSFINGLNFRINRLLRCGTGYVLYRQDNPNPTLKRSVTASPYISLSVDLDVAEWIKQLSGKFF